MPRKLIGSFQVFFHNLRYNLHPGNCLISKKSPCFFLAAFPSAHLCTTPCEVYSGHSRERDLGPRSISSLSRSVVSLCCMISLSG